MCGSGTLLIRSNNVAMDLPAQIFRKKFAFKIGKIMMLNCLPKSKNLESTELKNLRGKNVGLRH